MIFYKFLPIFGVFSAENGPAETPAETEMAPKNEPQTEL